MRRLRGSELKIPLQLPLSVMRKVVKIGLLGTF